MNGLSKQSGVALLLSLVILLVLSLLAISGMQGSVMQERMATAQRDGVIALETAEAGLREAETVLDGLTDLDDFGATDGFYNAADANLPDPFASATWVGGDQAPAIAGVAVDGRTPRFFFEYKGPVELSSEDELPRDLGAQMRSDDVQLESARIVVMAPGPSGNSRRLLESFYVFDPTLD